MTKLLDKALEPVRGLRPETQDEIARVVLQLAGDDGEPVALSSEERVVVTVSKAAAARGEFATEDQVRAIWAKYGPFCIMSLAGRERTPTSDSLPRARPRAALPRGAAGSMAVCHHSASHSHFTIHVPFALTARCMASGAKSRLPGQVTTPSSIRA